ncbi:MAG TPA: SxtJ family membrane protein [Pyrinomonadaceae bacterium]|nr:SxtJ family membrane protein [Pyrinomonadaceae bacterium]
MKSRKYRREREFGLIVGGVLVLLSSWWIYRGKYANPSHITLIVGGLLVLLGLTLPKSLIWPNRGWMLLAEALSYLSTRVILAIVFFLVITPIGIIKRMSGWDPLDRRSGRRSSYWRPYPERQRDTRHYEKMY